MMKQVPNCSYYKSASQICRGPGDFREGYELLEILRAFIVDQAVILGFGLSHSIAIGDGYSLNSDVYLSETLSQIRKGLVEHDAAYRQQGLLDVNGCVCGDYIDEYHNIIFEASGVRAIFYGGNLWWRIYPNPVPSDECQQCDK